MQEILSQDIEISQEKSCEKKHVSNQYCYLSDDSKKDAEWDRWRSNSQGLEQMLKLGDESDMLRYAERMQNCSKSLLFALDADSEGEVHHRLKNAFFCHFRHCAVCQARRSRRNYSQFLNLLPDILRGHEGARWLFLTLTVPNVPVSELRKQLKKMNEGWKRFLQRKEFKNVLAWVKSTEITKEDVKKGKREGYAHPHFHVLIMVKSSYFVRCNYINRDKWLEAWRGAMRDDLIVSVDVRIADRYDGRKLTGQELIKSVSETLKYSVKPSDMLEDRDWVVELIRQVYKLRFLAGGGILKSVFVKEKLTNEEMIHTGEEEKKGEEIAEWSYWWKSFEKKYARKRDNNILQ